MRRRAALVALAVVLLAAPAARADTTPIPADGSLPWSDPAHQTPLELLAGQIASHIAGRTVSVRCEGESDWNALAAAGGFDPSTELGYVESTFTAAGIVSVSTFTELSPAVCGPLQQFALAATKPTKCPTPTTQRSIVFVTRRVRLTQLVPVRIRTGGRTVVRMRAKTVVATRRVPVAVERQVAGAPKPCYAGGRAAADMPDAFWSSYADYATAILTLAHEAIHLSGVVTGTAGGAVVGDPEAEAKANCYGLQWMPYVATQLGDTTDDAQAIASYTFDLVYPAYRTFADGSYWSADCTSGGRLDIRADPSGPWP